MTSPLTASVILPPSLSRCVSCDCTRWWHQRQIHRQSVQIYDTCGVAKSWELQHVSRNAIHVQAYMQADREVDVHSSKKKKSIHSDYLEVLVTDACVIFFVNPHLFLRARDGLCVFGVRNIHPSPVFVPSIFFFAVKSPNVTRSLSLSARLLNLYLYISK